jgi:hypothetical protein
MSADHRSGKRTTSGSPAAGAGWKGLSLLLGGSPARCLQRGGAPARAAAAHPVSPAPARWRFPPLRTPGDRACKSSRAVLLAPGIVPPRKDHNQGRTSSLRCGRSTLILIFHGKVGRLPGGPAREGKGSSTLKYQGQSVPGRHR